MSKKMT